MDLQSYLVKRFVSWRPPAPTVEGRTKRDVTLLWDPQPFAFLQQDLMFWVQKKGKMPPWVMVYSGGKTTKTIDNLAPRHPHIFRLKVILKATVVATFADKARQFFGDEKTVFEQLESYRDEMKVDTEDNKVDAIRTQKCEEKEVFNKDLDSKESEQTSDDLYPAGEGDNVKAKEEDLHSTIVNDAESGDKNAKAIVYNKRYDGKRWLESLWSEETSTNTDTDGTSAVCFCMAVRCGYLKQVQVMLEERPALIEIINSNNGFTPLATAVRKGDINTVKFVLAAGAYVDGVSTTGQTPLHLAALGARVAIVELLLDRGADFQARDLNGLRIEHYAVDSGSQEMLTLVLQRGGDLHARDDNGWTPLFRADSIDRTVSAVTQGASTALIEQLVEAGSDVDAADHAGLTLPSAAKLLTNRQGRGRDSVLRLVDSAYPHEQAVANFTRLTKKISSLHTILK